MHVLALRLALSHLKQNLVSRFIVIFSVATILLINAAVFLLFQGFSRSLADVKSAQYVTAYLDASVMPSKEALMLSAVKKVPGVASAQLVSKDAFLENFSRYFPQLSTELAALDPEAIPRYLKIKVAASAPSEVDGVRDRLQKLKGIESVELNRNRFAGLIGALSTLRKLSLVLLVGMSLALICILLNHFKLGTAFQEQVRKTLGALGARGGYLLLPFVLEGVIEGALSGGLAAAGLLAYGKIFETQVNGLFSAIGYHPYHFELGILALALALIGMLSGMIGSVWVTLRVRAR